MDINEVITLIGHPESEILEYKAVLPSSRHLARLITAFANNKGGYIILGVKQNNDKDIEIIGLSKDFYVNTIVHSALDLLENKPEIFYQNFLYQNKSLFYIKVEKSSEEVKCEGKKYIRVDEKINEVDYVEYNYKKTSKDYILKLNQILINNKLESTLALNEFINHLQSILKVFDTLEKENILQEIEIKILSRILFSSCIDNFESYLSNLLLEIYLSNPSTLKNESQVSVREVLNCNSMQDFIEYYANQKIQKLQKGSVKGFLKDNKQISELNAINEAEINEVEKILQIRHLFTHRNGIIDNKFLQYYSETHNLHDEFIISLEEACKKLNFIFDISLKIDLSSSNKYNLNKLN